MAGVNWPAGAVAFAVNPAAGDKSAGLAEARLGLANVIPPVMHGLNVRVVGNWFGLPSANQMTNT